MQLPQPQHRVRIRRRGGRKATVSGHPRPLRGRWRVPELPAQHRGDKLQQVQAHLLPAVREDVGGARRLSTLVPICKRTFFQFSTYQLSTLVLEATCLTYHNGIAVK